MVSFDCPYCGGKIALDDEDTSIEDIRNAEIRVMCTTCKKLVDVATDTYGRVIPKIITPVDYFENGYAWQTFNRFERRLSRVLEYIPLHRDHVYVWSPVFRELLIQICSEIDGFFHNMVNSKSLENFKSVTDLRNKEKLDIADYREAFEPIFELSTAEVTIRDETHIFDVTKPFEEFRRANLHIGGQITMMLNIIGPLIIEKPICGISFPR